MVANEPSAHVGLDRTPFMVGRTGKQISTASMSSRNNLKTIAALLKERQPARTLEVGLALGSSALVIAGLHKAGGAQPAAQHIAIDPFQSSVWDDCGVLALEKAGLASFCRVIRDFSWRALPQLYDEQQEIGLLYIDGSHLFEDVFIDLFYSARLVCLNGLVLFDDASDQHVAKVIRFVRRNMKHAFRELDLSAYRDNMSASDRLKYSAAKAMGRVQLVAFERIGDPVRAWNSPFVAF